jgi:hypothetical protein
MQLRVHQRSIDVATLPVLEGPGALGGSGRPEGSTSGRPWEVRLTGPVPAAPGGWALRSAVDDRRNHLAVAGCRLKGVRDRQ